MLGLSATWVRMKSLLPALTCSTAPALPGQWQKAATGKQLLTLALLLAPFSGAWAQQTININNNSQIAPAGHPADMRICGNGAKTDPNAQGDCNNLDPTMDGNRVAIYAPVSESSMNVTGRLDESDTAATTGTNNSVTLDAGIMGNFYGAYAYSTEDGLDATLTGNKVAIDAPYAIVTANGGYARTETNATASSTDNQAIVIRGSLRGINGGSASCRRDCTADASGNTVSMVDTALGNWGNLVGGLANIISSSTNAVVTASNNTVAISGGTVETGGNQPLGGGYATCDISCAAATASGNTVQISGGTVVNSLIAGGTTVNGHTAIASDNTVEISGTAQIGAGVSLAGGQLLGTPDITIATDNTLKLGVSGVMVDRVSDFQNMDFDLPATLGNHGEMLISRQAVSVNDVSLGVGVQPGSPLQVGDEIVLIEGPNTMPTPSMTGALATTAITSLTTGYAFELVSVAGGSEENQLIVRVTNSLLLSFTCAVVCDIPASTVGTAITPRDVSSFALGGATPYTFTATGLPDGLSISAAGVISGTPTAEAAAGTATITVRDSTTTPSAQTASVTIHYGAVTAPGTPLSFTHSTDYDIPAMTAGSAIEPIDAGMGAAGGTQPYTFSPMGLPAGLSIDSTTGVISGTPTTAGANGSVTITVTDDASDSESITIAYGAIASPLTFTTRATFNIPPSTAGVAIAPVDVSVGVAGGQASYTYSATGLPIGLSISSAGVISGTPSAAGPADTAIIMVTDSTSPEPQTAHITIHYGATAPQTVTVGPQSGTLEPNGAAGAVTYHVTTVGIPDDTYQVTLYGAPAGVVAEDITLTNGAGTLTIDAPANLAAGTYTVTVTIDGVTSDDFTFTVGALPSASAAPIPTLSQWGLALLALLLAGGAAVRMRRNPARR